MEIIETDVNRCVGDGYCAITTAEKKFVNKIKKLKEQYPDEIKIIAENDNGSIYAHVPYDWFVFPRPPKKINYTPEQRAAIAERLKGSRSK